MSADEAIRRVSEEGSGRLSIPALQRLEERLGYCFTDSSLLIEALTHKSWHFENLDLSHGHNERLEYLGDSVLGMCIASYLYLRPEHLTEAMMSKIKSYVVKGTVLAEVARECDLGDYLRLGRGEEDTGGRQKRSLLSNSMESVIGAVYLDGGIEAARALIMRLFQERLGEVLDTGDYRDYKTLLQEICQERFGITPEYRIVGQAGAEHDRTFSVEVYVRAEKLGAGKGSSKKKAQKEAARFALDRLSSEDSQQLCQRASNGSAYVED